MKPKMIVKICVDIGMTIALLLLMPFELVGQAAHEWIGIGIFILSRHALSFLPISGGRSFGRGLHMLASYWGFVLRSLHLGLHWSMIMGMAKKAVKKPSAVRTWILRVLALAIAGYGVLAFVKREIGSYMLLKIQFVFFDFEEPLFFFLLDYLAIMGLFVFIGHYLAEILKYCSRKRKQALE